MRTGVMCEGHYLPVCEQKQKLDIYSARWRIQSRKFSITIDNQNGRDRAGINLSIKDAKEQQ